MTGSRRRPGRRSFALALWMVGFVVLRGPEAVADVVEERAARVKAAYLLNFARYAQWPVEAFERTDSPIVIAVVGACEAMDSLAEVIDRSPPIEGRRVELHRLPVSEGTEPDPRLFGAELVYVCALPPSLVPDLVRRLHEARTVLTVGDVPGFTGAGGMLGFVLEEDRIVFEANPRAIQESAVALSAKVLKLARIADPQGATP